jgi:hypothetical protein
MLAVLKPRHHTLALQSWEACVQADEMKRSCSWGVPAVPDIESTACDMGVHGRIEDEQVPPFP